MFRPPAASFRVIFFDCDSTLTTIEGIDELARLKGQYDHIADLTRRAMDGEIKLEDRCPAGSAASHARRSAPRITVDRTTAGSLSHLMRHHIGAGVSAGRPARVSGGLAHSG
jgi:hypothetical protein